MTTREYIVAIQKSDQMVFSKLYDLHREIFFGYFRKHYGKDDEYLADLYQEACITFWKNIQKGKLTENNLTSSIGTYLIGVGRFTLMARDRKYKEILNDKEITEFFYEYNEDSLRNEFERNEIIEETVKNMGEPCSILLDKYYWEELSGDEIAKQMDYRNADVVKTQKYKCMQKLKTIILPKIQDNN